MPLVTVNLQARADACILHTNVENVHFLNDQFQDFSARTVGTRGYRGGREDKDGLN